MRRLAVPLLVLLVLGGTGAAFGVTQALKTSKAPAKPVRWNETTRPGQVARALAPTCDCPNATLVLPVEFRKRDRVTLRVRALNGDLVATIAERRAVRRGIAEFEWNGRTAAGAVAPDGAYRLEVELARAGRTILFPARFRVDTTPPRPPRVLRPRRPQQLTPNGDGSSDRIWVRISSRDRARVVLSLDGEIVRVGSVKRAGRRSAIDWTGTRGGEPLPSGTYVLAVQLEDPLGNRSQPVAIQPIELQAEQPRRERRR